MAGDHYVLFPPVDRNQLDRLAAARVRREIERTGGRVLRMRPATLRLTGSRTRSSPSVVGNHVVRLRPGRLMVETRIVVPRVTRSPAGVHNIPDITLAVNETHDMSQYIVDSAGYIITNTQILNLNTSIATYSHATKLLTGVAGGTMSGLQYEVTSTEI